MTIEQRALARCNEMWCTNYARPDEIRDELDRDYYDGRVEAAQEQRQMDTEQFLSLLDRAIEGWNSADRHHGCRIDKEGAMRRFRKAMEDSNDNQRSD